MYFFLKLKSKILELVKMRILKQEQKINREVV